MIRAGRSRPSQLLNRLCVLRNESRSRNLHRKPSIFRRVTSNTSSSKDETPLSEALFPERYKKNGESQTLNDVEKERSSALPLPSVEELLEGQKRSSKSRKTTESASTDAFRQNKLAVLLLQSASLSLVENDFRRLCPKGKHIEGWTGLGDIERVFPGRDPLTLEQSPYYFLIFRNPAHARAYQANALRLYRHARAHTPTSILSPPPPSPGSSVCPPTSSRGSGSDAHLAEKAVAVVKEEEGGVKPTLLQAGPSRSSSISSSIARSEGAEEAEEEEEEEAKGIPESEEVEDAYQLLQDFAICSPSQRLQLTFIHPPFSPALQRLIGQGGYLGDRAGRSLLLSIDGPPVNDADELGAIIAREEGDVRGEQDVRIEELSDVVQTGSRNGKEREKSQVAKSIAIGVEKHKGATSVLDGSISNDDGNESTGSEELDGVLNGIGTVTTRQKTRNPRTDKTRTENPQQEKQDRPGPETRTKHPAPSKPLKDTPFKKYVLTFRDERETQRFMRSWNRRWIYPSTYRGRSVHGNGIQGNPSGNDQERRRRIEEPSIVRTDFLW